jgi:hypothetical protein
MIGRICNLRCNHSVARVAQNPKPYFTVSSETPQPGGPDSRIYILQEQGRPVIPLDTGFPLCHLLRLAGLHALLHIVKNGVKWTGVVMGHVQLYLYLIVYF